MTGISIQLELSAEMRERWEKLIAARCYAKAALIRAFIEAITDPVKGPQIEQIILNRDPAPAVHHNKKAPAANRRRRRHGGRRILGADHAKNISAKSRARQGRKGG
jgi:hypothetical protein